MLGHATCVPFSARKAGHLARHLPSESQPCTPQEVSPVLPEVPEMAAAAAARDLLLSGLQHYISTTHR